MVYPVDLDAQSPLSEHAMPLRDARAGAQILTFQVKTKQIWVTTLASDWRADEFVGMMSHEARTVVADDTDGQTINLVAWGIHPNAQGLWVDGCFSILVTRENIVAFHARLKEQGHDSAAEGLEELFFEFFIDDADWSNLIRR